MNLTIFQAYYVRTVAGRELELLFRGRAHKGGRLWFTELDPPYGDIFLRPSQIRELAPIGGNRRQI